MQTNKQTKKKKKTQNEKKGQKELTLISKP